MVAEEWEPIDAALQREDWNTYSRPRNGRSFEEYLGRPNLLAAGRGEKCKHCAWKHLICYGGRPCRECEADGTICEWTIGADAVVRYFPTRQPRPAHWTGGAMCCYDCAGESRKLFGGSCEGD